MPNKEETDARRRWCKHLVICHYTDWMVAPTSVQTEVVAQARRDLERTRAATVRRWWHAPLMSRSPALRSLLTQLLGRREPVLGPYWVTLPHPPAHGCCCVATGRSDLPLVALAFVHNGVDRTELVSAPVYRFLQTFIWWCSWPELLRQEVAALAEDVGSETQTAQTPIDRVRQFTASARLTAFFDALSGCEDHLDRLCFLVCPFTARVC